MMRTATRAVRRGICAAALLVPAPLLAQAPVITPAGDPSVRNDTIYSLAVRASDHPEEPHVLLLDDGVIRLEKDGTSENTYRMVAQVLRTESVSTWAEHTFSYDVDREEFRLNWARVLNADGTVAAERPLHVQESDASVPESYPVYTRRKVVRVSLSNVGVGKIVDYSYTIVTRDPVLRGDYFSSWFVNPGVTVRRSRLILDTPADLEPKIREQNLDFAARVQRPRGRVVRTWAKSDIPRLEPELFAADSNGIMQHITIGGALTWQDVGTWYAGLVQDRYELTPELEAAVDEVLEAAGSRLAALHELHRWIAQDIRYVSLSLGLGGYQPRAPAEVLATMSGDCKDKATLFVALARRLGYEAWPLLVSSSGSPRQDMPSIKQFDHMISAVRLEDGGWLYLDQTADIVPPGEVPAYLAGEFALLVRDDGTVEELTAPPLSADDNRLVSVLRGELAADGSFVGWFSQVASGFHQYELRSAFAQTFEGRARVDVTHRIANSVISGARGDSLDIFDGFDLAAQPRIGVKVLADRQLTRAADAWVFRLPLPRYIRTQVVDALEREPERRSMFAVAAVIGPQHQSYELRITMPEGWRAELPESVSAVSAFGRYESVYRQDGRELVISRMIRGESGTLPKESKAELLDWMRRIAADDASFIMLSPGMPAVSP